MGIILLGVFVWAPFWSSMPPPNEVTLNGVNLNITYLGNAAEFLGPER